MIRKRGGGVMMRGRKTARNHCEVFAGQGEIGKINHSEKSEG